MSPCLGRKKKLSGKVTWKDVFKSISWKEWVFYSVLLAVEIPLLVNDSLAERFFNFAAPLLIGGLALVVFILLGFSILGWLAHLSR